MIYQRREMNNLKIEQRADGLHISGYVNTVLRESRPVITPRGKVNEVIEERAFGRALEKTYNVPMYLDHQANRVLANTNDLTLKLREDNIGLHADALITDKEVIDNKEKLSGWSFGMRKVVDTVEERADKLPLRRIKDFALDHVTILLKKSPAYSSTSIELRADEEEATELEIRTVDDEVTVSDKAVETPKPKEPINYSKYENRILEIKVGL